METPNPTSNHYPDPSFSQLVSLLEAKSASLQAEKDEAERKIAAIRAEWARPVIQAVLAASEFSEPYVDGREDNTMWIDLGNAVRSNEEAWEDVHRFAQVPFNPLDEKNAERIQLAVGFGMLAGILYASMTGLTISPPPALPGYPATNTEQPAQIRL